MTSVIGSSADFSARIIRIIPAGWMSNPPGPYASAIIGGVSDALAATYSLLSFAVGQTRLASATSFWLDLAAFDFLGLTYVRSSGQSDASFSKGIRLQIVQPRVTRAGVISVIENLLDTTPIIFEPWNTSDAGAWDVETTFFWWDVGGGWGETTATLPGQVFMIVTRSGWQGVPAISGWDDSFGGWDVGSSIEWIDDSMLGGTITDNQIYSTIATSVAEGVIAWVQLTG